MLDRRAGGGYRSLPGAGTRLWTELRSRDTPVGGYMYHMIVT